MLSCLFFMIKKKLSNPEKESQIAIKAFIFRGHTLWWMCQIISCVKLWLFFHQIRFGQR